MKLHPTLARQEASFSNCSNSHLAFEQDFSHTWQRPYTAYMYSDRESVSGVDSDLAQYFVVVEFQLRPEAVSRNPWRGEVPQEGAREAAIALNCRLSFIVFHGFMFLEDFVTELYPGRSRRRMKRGEGALKGRLGKVGEKYQERSERSTPSLNSMPQYRSISSIQQAFIKKIRRGSPTCVQRGASGSRLLFGMIQEAYRGAAKSVGLPLDSATFSWPSSSITVSL